MSSVRPTGLQKILIVDDHPMAHQVLGTIARGVFRGAQILFASGLREALQVATDAGEIDLVLLDLGLPGCSGIEALTSFQRSFPGTRVVVVSATEDRVSVVRVLEAGAHGYVPKTHAPPLIGAALRLVVSGGTYVPPQALQPPGTAMHGLTGRQYDVLRRIVKGFPDKAIAQQLGIAKDTVKQHARAVYRAFGVSTRSQAASAAKRRGIKFD